MKKRRNSRGKTIKTFKGLQKEWNGLLTQEPTAWRTHAFQIFEMMYGGYWEEALIFIADDPSVLAEFFTVDRYGNVAWWYDNVGEMSDVLYGRGDANAWLKYVERREEYRQGVLNHATNFGLRKDVGALPLPYDQPDSFYLAQQIVSQQPDIAVFKGGEFNSWFLQVYSLRTDYRGRRITTASSVDEYREEGGRFTVEELEALYNISKEMVIAGDFLIGKYEVTEGLYNTFMLEKRAGFPLWPKANVSWYDAIEFCNKLSEHEGLEPCYSYAEEESGDRGTIINFSHVIWNRKANGYRLPTSEEWEIAARAGTDLEYAGSNEVDLVAWYEGNSKGHRHIVGQLMKNRIGTFDMTGNVSEWCWDRVNYHGARIVRGGSWDDGAWESRISFSSISYDTIENRIVGFRLAKGAVE
jgi:hypothetical protein